MKPGSTTTRGRPRKRARNDAIPFHKKKIRTQPSAGKVRLTVVWDERGVILEHYMARGNTVTSATYSDLLKNHLRPAVKSKRRGFLVQVFCCSMKMLGPILPVQLLQQSKICSSSVFHIRHTRQTSPPVIFMCLGRSNRRWEASLSGPTKRSSRRCMSGCVLSQKNFFIEASMHFRNAGTLVLHALETT